LERTTLTYRYERLRAIAAGVLETAGTSFLLLIAVKWFEFGATAKALIAMGGSLGLLAGPLIVSLVENRRWHTSHAAAVLAGLGSVCYLVMALAQNATAFVFGAMLVAALSAGAIPLATQIYQENYPKARRGQLFSRTAMIRIASVAVFSYLAGSALNANAQGMLEIFPQWLIFIFAGAFAFASFCFSQCPSRPLQASGGTHPFRSLRFVREDKLFRFTLACWMGFGIANLMMFPLRVDYLARDGGFAGYGLNYTPERVALLTVTIPSLVRLVLSPFWGRLFDRMNFFDLRVILNLCFGVATVAFFATGSLTGIVIGAIFFGIATSGGEVAWSLWVTKFAPADRVADYMSVHTFFTGVRGCVAPFIGFYLIEIFRIHHLAWVSFSLMAVASLVLLTHRNSRPEERHGEALTEDVTE